MNNKVRIYHGSINKIQKPVFGQGKTYNDYGLGFYCTESYDMACEWSVGIDHDGQVNIYDLDLTSLKVLNLNDPKYCILHWLTFLIVNRKFDSKAPLAYEAKKYLIDNFLIKLDGIDIIIGYRADDKYFSYAQDFLNGTISIRQLKKAMQLGKLGEQIVLISKKSFNKLSYIDSRTVNRNDWYFKKENRINDANDEYFDAVRNKLLHDDLFIFDIIKEGISSNDERLR